MSKPKPPPLKAVVAAAPPEPQCGNCRHWRYRETLGNIVTGFIQRGNCTAHPPGIVAEATAFGPLTVHCVVRYDESCGEFTPRANG